MGKVMDNSQSNVNNESAKPAAKHRWKFFRYGGIDQVSLETGEDLLALDKLDPKLWAAMICPVSNIEFDARTLEYLDTDKDKRIKITEILAGLKWVCSVLKNPEDLIHSRESLPLNAINSENPEGAMLLASARHILKSLGKEKDESISLVELADTQKIFAATAFNGDGIVTVESAANESCRKLIGEIIDCAGSDVDRSGRPGISEERLNTFFAESAAYSGWLKKAQDGASVILFAGADTVAQASVFLDVKAKVDDFFTRCQLASFDETYSQAGQVLEGDYVALLKKSLSAQTSELKEFPLAMINQEALLPLRERVNPAWVEELAMFTEKVVKPIVGETSKLSETQWVTIKNKFKAYEVWQSQKAGVTVEKLGEARINEILKSGQEKYIRELIAHDKALEPEFNAITSVDKLVRYYRYLYTLLNNFVAFKDFYSNKNKAVFQVGTLYMDSRSCDLCVKIDDVGKHSGMASSCNTFLVYCECVRQGAGEKINIAAAFTDGDSDQLITGRNGLFVDRKGNYWDATIVKIIDHPISIRQAFWSPYKRLGHMIHEQIEKFASSKDKTLTDSLSASVTETSAKIAATAPAAPPQPFDAGKFAGIFAAIGLAMAAIGSAIATVVAGFMSLLWWQLPLAGAGILLMISGPSMLLAAMRLRQRNLGAILDANGWAVNTRAQINMAFGKTLTSMAELPKGSIQSLADPFAEKKSPWKLYLLLILVIAAIVGMLASPKARGRIKRSLTIIFHCAEKPPRADSHGAGSGLTLLSAPLPASASVTAPTSAPGQ